MAYDILRQPEYIAKNLLTPQVEAIWRLTGSVTDEPGGSPLAVFTVSTTKYLPSSLWTRIDSHVFLDLDDQENGKPWYNGVIVPATTVEWLEDHFAGAFVMQHNTPVEDFHKLRSEKDAYMHYDEYFLTLGGLISREQMSLFDKEERWVRAQRSSEIFHWSL